jgi:prepilin-type N-terminal cleavage/methylation domain-containing protein
MKLKVCIRSSSRAAPPKRGSGFTLVEILVSLTVFTLLVAGVVAANIYGLSMYQIAENKLNDMDDARKTIGGLADEIRACNSAWIGNVSNGVFVALLNGQTQQGGGLLIYPTTNTANFIVYFVNQPDSTFRRTTSTPGTAVILANSITNTAVFAAQDYLGNVLTNNQNNRVIHFTLEFYQPGRFLQSADYYKLETSVTRRALN